jgi:hypothetical protein
VDPLELYADPLSRRTAERLMACWAEHIRSGQSMDELLNLAGTRGQDSIRTQFLRDQRNRHFRYAFHSIEIEHPELTAIEIAENLAEA